MSKQLDSILTRVPAATAVPTYTPTPTVKERKITEPIARIVAEVPKSLKEQIKHYVNNNPGQTERTVLLKALKEIGFKVDETWLVDNRTLR